MSIMLRVLCFLVVCAIFAQASIAQQVSRRAGVGTLSIADGDKCDITVSGGGTCWDLDVDAITDAHVPNTITINHAGTATALSADPAPCLAIEFVTDTAADGDLTCRVIDPGDIPFALTTDGGTIDGQLIVQGGTVATPHRFGSNDTYLQIADNANMLTLTEVCGGTTCVNKTITLPSGGEWSVGGTFGEIVEVISTTGVTTLRGAVNVTGATTLSSALTVAGVISGGLDIRLHTANTVTLRRCGL